MTTAQEPTRRARRAIFDDDHEDFRESVRRFLANEAVPHIEQWEKDGLVPREAFAQAGGNGFLGMQIPEEHGGAGVDDFRFNVVVNEECCYAGLGGYGLGVALHNDICLPYFLEYCTPEQKERWLPGIADGTLITAVAMTEPGIGSDLGSMKAKAIQDGDHYVVNGAKTFITNGINADLVITAVKTDPNERHKGISLVVVERDTPGFERGRNLEKVGMHSQDTAELFFNDAQVPVANRLADEGKGFSYLVANLAQERLSIAISGVATSEAALQATLEYVRERTAFGQSIGSFQNTRFVLAECRTEIDVAQAFVDQCITELGRGELTVERAAEAKMFCTELQGRVVDKCLQMFGGYGYMLEYPIARMYADARVTRIYGGANEIMREIVGRSMGL
jgi:alkylation response protein AidB-like acyl-CoA dehydrogenase